MELTDNIRRIIIKFLLITLACCIVLWFSVFSYCTLYYLYIPAIAHVKPIHLKYDSRQEPCSTGKNCNFPSENLTLVEPGQSELLTGGQAYAIEVAIELPESERNFNQGVFMVHLDMLSKHGEIIKTSRRPAILKYRSPFFKYIYTLFFVPVLLAGTLEEKQSVSIPLFEKYVEDSYQPAHYAFVEIEAANIEVYSCSLRIHAQFTGLRYMMYYWPILSAVMGIGTNFFLIAVVIVFLWVRQIMNTTDGIEMSNLSDKEQDVIHEIRQSLHKEQGTENIEESGLRRRRGQSKSPDRAEEKESEKQLYRGLSRSRSSSHGRANRSSSSLDDEDNSEFYEVPGSQSETEFVASFSQKSPRKSPMRKRVKSHTAC